MFSLLITLCIAGNCYVNAPMQFDNMADCVSAMKELRETGQVRNMMICKKEEE